MCVVDWSNVESEAEELASSLSMTSLIDVVPSEQLAHNRRPEATLFVDIGGGIGSQCAAIRAKFPQAPVRVVL